MLVATHCHTHYSFDCNTSIVELVNVCKRKNIGCIFITDHDLFGLSNEDLNLFFSENIVVLNAIEFTTKEGAHVIGVHPRIKRFERERYFYKTADLIKILKEFGVWISIPHPTHETGILSVGLDKEELEFCFENSHFIEQSSSKYGKFEIEGLLKKYINLKPIVSDDAHRKEDVGIMLNKIEILKKNEDIYDEILSSLYEKSVYVFDEKQLIIRRLKKIIHSCKWYQFVSRRMSRKFKNKIITIIKRGQ
jgi:histidinol phosphatase-like PHP family hydrolase